MPDLTLPLAERAQNTQLDSYLRQIRRYPLLTAEEELALGRVIQSVA